MMSKNTGVRKIAAIFLAGLLCFFAVQPAFAMARRPERFPIRLIVDFGPAEKPGFNEIITIESGMTAKDALMTVFPVKAGESCCSLREVMEINGVAVDRDKDYWWICLLNGNKNFSPRKKKLNPNDQVEWKYIPNDHCKLKA